MKISSLYSRIHCDIDRNASYLTFKQRNLDSVFMDIAKNDIRANKEVARVMLKPWFEDEEFSGREPEEKFNVYAEALNKI